MPSSNFSTPPPRELIEAAVQALGFDDLNDTRWVNEHHANEGKMREVRERLRQYLYPCIAKTYLDKEDFKYRDYVTLVRQLLKTQKRKLLYKDACFTKSRRVYEYKNIYSLEPAPKPAVVRFESIDPAESKSDSVSFQQEFPA